MATIKGMEVTKGCFIKLGEWNGKVLDVLESPTDTVFLIMFAKNIVKRQRAEYQRLSDIDSIPMFNSSPQMFLSEVEKSLADIRASAEACL